MVAWFDVEQNVDERAVASSIIVKHVAQLEEGVTHAKLRPTGNPKDSWSDRPMST